MNLTSIIYLTNAFAVFILTQSASAKDWNASSEQTEPVLADAFFLREIGAKVMTIDDGTGVGFAHLNADQELNLSRLAHAHGRCGGFEVLPSNEPRAVGWSIEHVFRRLVEHQEKDRNQQNLRHGFLASEALRLRSEITDAIALVSEQGLRQTVEFLSSFHSRDNRADDPNKSIRALKTRIDQSLKSSKIPYKTDFVSHQSTRQNSIRLRFPGRVRPSEIVVLGAHADSINWEDSEGDSPGADDNASGSANLLETARILSQQAQPERTVEFFWYAGEETGLLGSAEIAADYQSQSKDVIGVLQLDMTMYPGSGEGAIGSMTDFTSPWLQQYLEQLSDLYVKVKVIRSECGYACSDHVSWYRQGYPTLMPGEATYAGSNQNLHTNRDRIDAHSSFRHLALFSRIALAFAMDLGNSDAREPSGQ